MTADNASSPRRCGRAHRPTGALPAAPLPPLLLLLLLPLLLATLAVADEGAPSSTGPEICLESDGAGTNAAPLLVLDWTDDAPLPGCACELLSADNDSANDEAPPPSSPPTPSLLAVSPADSRVLRLLRPSAHLSCSARCGRVAISAIGDTGEWVSAGQGVVGLGATVSAGGCSSGRGAKQQTTARAFSSSCAALGGDGAAVHALRLRATQVGGQAATVTTAKASTLPRAAAALLFVGLNAAAALLPSSPR